MKLRAVVGVLCVGFGLACLAQPAAGPKPPGRIVFLVDGTGSMMSKHREQHAVVEKMIGALGAEQRFVIIDYRREAVAASSAAFVPATVVNKRKALCYLHDEQPAGGGGPGEAMVMAFKYEPDTIVFLSDGEMPEPEKVIRDLRTRNAGKRVRLHVIGFGMEYEKAAERLKVLEQFAKENGGEYRDVAEADYFVKRIGVGGAADAPAAAPVAAGNAIPPVRGVGRVVVLVDGSGSMSERWEGTRAAASKLVGELDPRQRFALIHFEDHKVDGTSADCVAATATSVAEAQEKLRLLYPFAQGDPLPALEAAFKAKPDVIYFFSDGDYAEFDKVLRLMKEKNVGKRVKVHAVVVGEGPGEENGQLLKKLATENGGEYVVVEAPAKAPRAVKKVK